MVAVMGSFWWSWWFWWWWTCYGNNGGGASQPLQTLVNLGLINYGYHGSNGHCPGPNTIQVLVAVLAVLVLLGGDGNDRGVTAGPGGSWNAITYFPTNELMPTDDSYYPRITPISGISMVVAEVEEIIHLTYHTEWCKCWWWWW